MTELTSSAVVENAFTLPSTMASTLLSAPQQSQASTPAQQHALNLAGHALSRVNSTLSQFEDSLARLCIAGNALATLAGLPSLPALTHLDVSYNDLRTLFPLPQLPALLELQVRSVSHTGLSIMMRRTHVLGAASIPVCAHWTASCCPAHAL